MNTVDLTEICNRGADECGREPIHLSSAIQPHGVLIGLDAKTLGLVTRSANTGTIFGNTPLSAIPNWLPQTVIAACRELGDVSGRERTLNAEFPGIGKSEVHCFAASGIVFCELELPAIAPPEPFAPECGSLLVAQAIKDMEGAKDLTGLAATGAQAVRAVSGFERVMVLRFEVDGDGEVTGESLAPDWDQSFMGLRFPASDIPPQARALYRVSHERWIPVRDYESIPLEPSRSRGGEPFDLSLSLYRSISPVHQAYQQNIGVDGAMSLSLLCDGALWGLIIGHHRQPHRVSATSRNHAAAIMRAFNMMLAGRLNRRAKVRRAVSLPSNSGILSKLATAEDCRSALTEGEPSILDLLPNCTGAAVIWNDNGAGQARTLGETPPVGDIFTLAAWIRSNATQPVFCCDCISDGFPQFLAHREKASGVLAIFFEDARQPVLLLFRPEAIRSVSWAGKPEKLAGPTGTFSLPRRSFDLWIEAKRNHSETWKPKELEVAADLLATANYVLVHEAYRKLMEEALHQSQERLKFALEAGEVGTWELSIEFGEVAASDRALSLLDLPPGVQPSCEEVRAQIHPDDRGPVDEALQRTVQSGNPFQIEWRRPLPDGSVRWLETRGERRSVSGKQVIGGLIQDITTRIEQKEEVEKASKAKSEFLSNMSHELRTPMHAILGYSEIALEAIDEGETQSIRKYLRNIGLSGKRLLGLLNDLLNLAKMEADRVEYNKERADLKEVIEYALMELDPLIRAKNLNMSVDLERDTQAVFDKPLMIQLVINLLSNAIKFSSAGGQILITLFEERPDGGETAVGCRITDEGPGIPDDELQTVFNKFIQSSKTKTGAGGTGLGLAICLMIIEAHGGKIWAENAKPKGAVFSFVIPKGINAALQLPAERIPQ